MTEIQLNRSLFISAVNVDENSKTFVDEFYPKNVSIQFEGRNNGILRKITIKEFGN